MRKYCSWGVAMTLAVACGTAASPPTTVNVPPPSPSVTPADARDEAPVHAGDTTQASELDARTAEREARAAWFGFELEAVDATFGGDWVAFYRHKHAEEEAHAQNWEAEAGRYAFRSYRPTSATEVRALRMLHLEFERVAKPREAELRERASAVLAAIVARRFDEVARDCVFYGGADREALCRKHLEGRANELVAAAKTFDPAVGFVGISFEAPNPATGMVGRARLSFGPVVRRPRNAEDRYPERHQVELWWSGQVMPDANGPVHAAPLAPGAADGRWRFYDLVTAYSRTPTRLQ